MAPGRRCQSTVATDRHRFPPIPTNCRRFPPCATDRVRSPQVGSTEEFHGHEVKALFVSTVRTSQVSGVASLLRTFGCFSD